LGLIGAVIGGVIGHRLFLWIAQNGYYGLMIPGALVGLGCSQFALHRSMLRGLVCALGAIFVGLYSEWKHAPFRANDGFGYLLSHVSDLNQITLLMIALGGVFGFWLGKDASPWLAGLLPAPAEKQPESSAE